MKKSHTEIFAFHLQNELKNATILFHHNDAWISFQSLAEISCLSEEKLIETLNKFLITDEMKDDLVFLYWLPPKTDIYGMEEPPEFIEFFSLEVAMWLLHRANINSKPLEEYTKWASGKLQKERPNPYRSLIIYMLTVVACIKLSKIMLFDLELGLIVLTVATLIIFLAIETSVMFFLGMIIFCLVIMLFTHSIAILLFPLAITTFIAVASYKSREETQFTHKKESLSSGYENFRNSVFNL